MTCFTLAPIPTLVATLVLLVSTQEYPWPYTYRKPPHTPGYDIADFGELPSPTRSFPEFRLAGGMTAEEGQLKYQARIEIGINFHTHRRCGGTLVEVEELAFIITAAHCVWKGPNYNDTDTYTIMDVFLGDLDRTNTGKYERVYGVKKVMIHQDFDPRISWNDIALIFLDKVVVYYDESTYPAFLPTDHDFPLPERVIISGWGNHHAQAPDGPRKLEYIEHQTVKWNYCHRFNGNGMKPGTSYWFLSPNDFCTINPEQHFFKGPCAGDSGGPVVGYSRSEDKFYLVGIVSHGYGPVCGLPGVPAAQLRVSHYIDWIKGAAIGFKKAEKWNLVER